MPHIIHLIEEISNHLYHSESGAFLLDEFVPDEENVAYDAIKSDSFFYSEEEDLSIAITKTLNKVFIENEDGHIVPVSIIIKKYYDDTSSEEIGLKDSKPGLSKPTIYEDVNSNLTKIEYSVIRSYRDFDYLELHSLEIFATKMESIVDVDK